MALHKTRNDIPARQRSKPLWLVEAHLQATD